MKAFTFFIVLSVLFSSTSFANDEKNTVTANLKTVTIYRTGAEMIHTAKAMLLKGNNELVVEGISNYVDINSIQVNCPSLVTILGLEFSNNYLLPEIVSPVLKKIRDSAEKLNNEIEKINISLTTTSDLIAVLKSNREIKGSQTGLSVAELMKLMDYYKTKSNELQNELSLLNNKKNKLQTQVQKLNNQAAEEEKKNIKSGGRIILQLSAALPGEQEFTISYITQNAYWTPYYDIKAEGVNRPLTIIYKAKIAQTTGIDWRKVKLSLSTSTPSQYGAAPLLKSWFLSYINPVRQMEKDLSMSNSIPSGLTGKVSGLITESSSPIALRGIRTITGDNKPLYVVNGAVMEFSDFGKLNPNSIQNVEVMKNEQATSLYGPRGVNGAMIVTLKDGLEDYISITDNALDVTYDIDLPYDVPTNGKQQVATLKEASIPAIYKYYAVPKLDKDAYLLAEVTDWEKLNLLPGEANIIFEGTYVGKSFLDPASTNDTLNLTLGKDKRVIIKREKLTDYSSSKLIGTNKVQTITYELTVKNNKKDPISLLLKDQYPISTNKEIEVALLESSDAADNAEIGVLTWKLQLAPGESKKVRISYSAKYPKGKVLNLN
ncbi:MAG: mucoidy inhibitor MuiA family protein [Ferruginibacter sp.]|nr:mucoidy inhibitor MuiA family protein [Ferruginibacter sp.]